MRRYGFQYDHLNRLNEAIYQKPETTGADNSYNESINYDRNGNITALSRNGYLDGDGSNVLTIDNLEYVYKFNQLYSVTDYTMSLDGFKDGNQQGYDYDYDANGNMRKDLNKGISSITYNHLNLPVYMDFGLNKNITYIYNALGVKLTKRVSTPQGQNETVYSNGFQYQDTKLQHFPTAEGYVSIVEGKINYVYNYTDHLGNIRLSYGLDPEVQGQLKILAENHYYPYGLKHSNYNAIEYAYKENELGTYVVLDPTQRSDYRYKYNGMEFQDELGLNLYDMDFRDYDPAIARWTGIDPVTHHNMSPYMAFDSNPVFWADPSGADSIGGNALDVFGRDKFDTNNMYIPFAERGVGSFDEYLSQDGGGDGGGNSEIEAIFENALTGGIFIKFGGFLGLWTKTVQYVNGVLMKDGQLYTGKISNFVRSVLDALTTIGQKPIGLQLINAISNGPLPVTISRGSNKYLISSGVKWNPNDTSGGIDLNGNTSRPSFIGLAHELAHNYDFRFDGRTGYNSQGFWSAAEKVYNAEIFAGNVENLIRQEHNLTQRAFYGIDQNGNGFGAYKTSLHLIINNIQDGRLY